MARDMDYAGLSDRFVKALRLETAPVTVLFSAKPPDGVQKLAETSMACTMLDLARHEGRTFYTDASNHTCKNGAFYLGIEEPFDGLLSGEANAGIGGSSLVCNPAAFQRLLEGYEIVPQGRVTYLSYAPLAETPFPEKLGGMVAVFFVTPRQSLFLERGINYRTGAPVESLTGPATCSSIMAAPFMTGKPFTTHNCFGFNLFTKVKAGEMMVGIPMHMLPDVIANLEEFQDERPDLAAMRGREEETA